MYDGIFKKLAYFIKNFLEFYEIYFKDLIKIIYNPNKYNFFLKKCKTLYILKVIICHKTHQFHFHQQTYTMKMHNKINKLIIK